jgi:DNA ligase-1
MKIVPEVRVDALVVDVLEGKGKYAGMAGSLLCKMGDGTFIRVANRFSDEQRKRFFNHPGTIINCYLELIMKEKSKHGKLRSGRCVRIRRDK